MTEQIIPENAVVVPDLDPKDQKKIIKEVKKHELIVEKEKNGKNCVVCGKNASHCMRGIPQNTYCKDCAQEHFKFLNYLEKL